MLTARDATLMRRIESGMGELRAALQRGQSADQVATRVQVHDGLCDDAAVALSPDASRDAPTFIVVFTLIRRTRSEGRGVRQECSRSCRYMGAVGHRKKH